MNKFEEYAEARIKAHHSTDQAVLDELASSTNPDIRAAVACNNNVSRETIARLLSDDNCIVKYEANRNEAHKEWIMRQKALYAPL